MISSHGRLCKITRAATAALTALGLAAAGPIEEAEPHLPSDGKPAPVEAEETPVGPRKAQGLQIGASVPTGRGGTAVPALLDMRVTVRVKGAPLATFLDTISAQAKVNFIITEGLESRRVTAFLQNVTVREALQVLLEIKGLTYQQIGKSNTYVVTPRSKQVENLITRIYTLNYIPLIPLPGDTSGGGASAGATRSSAKSAGGASERSGGGASERSGGGASPKGGPADAGAGGGASPRGGGGGSSSSDVAIISVLQSVLSRSGHVVVEPRTNAIIVTDVPEVFPQVEQIISELDKKAPQVMIEAQIVEINSNRSRNLGFEWGGANGELGSFTAGRRDTAFPLNLPHNLSRAGFFDPLNPSGGIISSIGASNASASKDLGATSGGFLQTSILDLTALKIVLHAMISRREGRYLGKPKILTLNNKSASIEITSEEAVAIQTTDTGLGGSTARTTKPERMDTGLTLKVTPQINKEGYITMLVEPSFTNTDEALVSGASNRIFNAKKRSAATMVRVKNGQTLVLGGLLDSKESKLVKKVPFLGYIPIIGWLFTSSLTERVNNDLVIFITPTIVND